MRVNDGIEESYRNSQNSAFQRYRPAKAQMLSSQRSSSIMDNNESFKLPNSSWSNSTPQNIELKLTYKGTYLRDTSSWSDMQYEAEDTVCEPKNAYTNYPPKKRFLGKVEMEADQAEYTVESSLPTRIRSPYDSDYLSVSTKCLKETILQCRNAIEADSTRPNTKASEFLHRTFGDIAKNNNVDAEKNMNLCIQNAQDQKTSKDYRSSGFKKFTLRRIEEDSNDSNVIETPPVIEQVPEIISEQIEVSEVNEPRGKRNRACKGVRYQQFMNDTLSKRQNKKLGPKKLLNTTETVTKRRKGKKSDIKEEMNQVAEINSLPIQSRRETRNSAKAAALLKQKESSDEMVEDNKRKLIPDVCKDLNSTSIMVLPKKRFRANENDNQCKTSEEPKRLPSPLSSETSSSRLSSPESSSSNSSTHVHYKKLASRTFVAESQIGLTSSTLSNTDVNLQTLADVALRGIQF